MIAPEFPYSQYTQSRNQNSATVYDVGFTMYIPHKMPVLLLILLLNNETINSIEKDRAKLQLVPQCAVDAYRH